MPQLRERKRMIRGDGDCFFQHGLRRDIKFQLCVACRHYADSLDMPGFEFEHSFKARNGFRMSLLHVQHDARLVPAVGEFRVEFNRLLQAGQGQGELVHLALNEAEIEPGGWRLRVRQQRFATGRLGLGKLVQAEQADAQIVQRRGTSRGESQTGAKRVRRSGEVLPLKLFNAGKKQCPRALHVVHVQLPCLICCQGRVRAASMFIQAR